MINRMFFDIGLMHGIAIGMHFHQTYKKTTAKPKLQPQDNVILEYIRRESKVYAEDITAYLGITDNNGNRISVGHSMRRLGWVRRRGSDMRWFYERGANVTWSTGSG